MVRVHNFNAGPAVLPAPVLRQVQEELVILPGQGMSVMEMSHRSAAFDAILDKAESGLRNLLGLSNDYAVLFLQGGASLQFSMIPMNLLRDIPDGQPGADFILTGSWGTKAYKEAGREGCARIAATTKKDGFTRLPSAAEVNLDPHARYVHYVSNETIEGVQWRSEPETAGVPLVCDASSDILSRPLDIAKYGLIFAGAQKNIGPSGVTVVIIRKDWIHERPALPTMLSYDTHYKDRSLYNTPNTFGIYMIGLVCDWIQGLGGLAGMEQRAEAKAALLYEVIDGSDFYTGHAQVESRSRMNVTWRLPTEELESRFEKEARARGFVGLKGHRSVGGLRASIYNALEPESVLELVYFMKDFEARS